ncbi:MAG: TIGR01777 family protein [Leptolyngbyaceae cyanobacterium SL_7_1]|nr:TIGR01777 family protein [Leptolyngbyaceae cyanobacterium SL_7_1]
MKVAITGATGFVGTRLVERLQAEGHEVLVLTRDADRGRRCFPIEAFPKVTIAPYTPLESGEWQRSIDGCDGVVNLAGAPIAEGRWTPERQKIILDSRKVGTEKIVEAIAQATAKPSVLVNSSAIGYYGTSETAMFDEGSSAGDDFLASVCQAWEAAAQTVKQTGTRLVILRTGIVLEMGGAVEKMLLPFKLFAGGPLGSGRQWFSWVHREDVVNLIVRSLTTPSMEGVYNATAPNPVRMAEFCRVLGEVLHRPSWLPVPEFALEALLGSAAQVVLEGQRVFPKRTLEADFDYQYPQVKSALESFLK